MVRTEHYDALK